MMIKHCIVCLGLFSNLALAADHSPYEPVVPIDEEPSHRLVLKSASIRVFDVVFPVEKKSLWHLHDKDSVLICLQGADVPSEEPGKALVVRPPIPSGLIYYRGYATTPFVHRITNAGQTEFRILDIEVLTSQKVLMGALPALASGWTVVLENDRVRVSKRLLQKSEGPATLDFQGPHLLVTLSAGKFAIKQPSGAVEEVVAPAGLLRMEEKPARIALEPQDGAGVEVVVVEVK